MSQIYDNTASHILQMVRDSGLRSLPWSRLFDELSAEILLALGKVAA